VWHTCDIRVTYMWLVTRMDSSIRVTSHTNESHSYVRHASFNCLIWRIGICWMNRLCMWHDSFICVTWLIHVCAMIHAFERPASFTCVIDIFIFCIRHIRICHMTYSYLLFDSFNIVIFAIRHVPIRYMTYSYLLFDSSICVTRLD